jgi:dienelactone hydrolase
MISTQDWLSLMAREAPLRMVFRGRSEEDWRRWQGEWRDKLADLMGRVPDRAPLQAETLERVELEGYVREKVVYQSDRHATVPAYVLYPDGLGQGEKRPGILCAHGHCGSNVGMEAVAGIDEDERVRDAISAMNYDYGRRLALRGYVTIVPGWRAFGERYDRFSTPGRDPCNVCQNSCSWLGYNLLTLDVFDARTTLDYLQERPEVDPDRIGMVGLSYGGRMTTFTAALEPRIKVAVVSGALNCFVERIQALGSCGSQVVPGLLLYGDIPEVLGLVAPRPLLIQRGLKDELLPAGFFEEGYSRLARVYDAAGVPERLDRDEFDGGHMFHGDVAYDWFDRWL